MEGWKDRGWSWKAIVAQSLIVGSCLGFMTSRTIGGSRGPVIFGVAIGVGWFVAFSIVKLARERAETGERVALKLGGSFLSVGLYVLLVLAAALILIAVLAGEPAVAVPTAVLAAPLLIGAFLRRARKHA